MTRSKRRAATAPAFGRLGRILPMLLLTLLVVALVLPAGAAISPGFLGPVRPQEPAAAGPWQQLPATLSAPGAGGPSAGGARPLSDAAPVPDATALAAQLNATLKTDGAGSFSGVVQDAVTGEVLFDRAGDEVRAPASNIKLLTAAAAPHAWPGPALQHQGRRRHHARHRCPDRRRGRAARRGGVGAGCRAGPCRARHPRAVHRQCPPAGRRLRPGDRAAG